MKKQDDTVLGRSKKGENGMDLADAERKTRSTYDLCSVEHTSLSQIFLHFLTFFFLFCFGKRFWSQTCGLDPRLLHSCVLQCAFQPFFFSSTAKVDLSIMNSAFVYCSRITNITF